MPRRQLFNEEPGRFFLQVDRERGLRWQAAARAAGYERVEGWIVAAADILEERTRKASSEAPT